MYFLDTVLDFHDINYDVHYNIGGKLTKSFTKGLIMIPRKHMKTCQITIGWTIWMWIRNPNLRFGIGSATEKLAEDITGEIKKQVSQNPKFVELFGDWSVSNVKGRKLKWTKTSFDIGPKEKISKDASLTTFSVGKAVTGAHFDVIILDDLAIRQNSMTQDMRDKQINLYKDCLDLIVSDELKPFLDGDQKEGVILLVGTRWHFSDVYSHMLAKSKNELDFIVNEPCFHNPTLAAQFPNEWKRMIKVLIDHPDTTMLCDGVYPKSRAISDYKDKGTYEFSCQQMNHPVSDEGAAFKAEDIVFKKIEEIPGGLENYLLVDPAGIDSTYEKADDWAFVTACITTDNSIVVKDVLAESKISMGRAITLLETADLRHGPRFIRLEQDVLKAINHILKTESPVLFRKIKPFKASNMKSKMYKMLGLQPYVENNKLIIVEDKMGDPGVQEYPFMDHLVCLTEAKHKLLMQIVDFGNTEHDDCIDALSNILEIIRPNRGPAVDRQAEYNPINKKCGY